jgi:hypothetical protein
VEVLSINMTVDSILENQNMQNEVVHNDVYDFQPTNLKTIFGQ